MKLSIVIPIYNEKETLLKILKKVEEADILGLEKEIILVDDGSTDGTREILKNLGEKYLIIYHSKNQGKGRALRTGFQQATGDIVLIQDADLEYNPQNYPKLLRPILENKTDIVYGSRALQNNPYLRKSNYWGAKLISWLTNLFYGSNLTDVYTCYKVFRSPILKEIKLESRGFDFEQEITSKILKKGCKIIEVPIDYSPRGFEEGKKIRTKDGFIAIWKILKYRLFQ